MSKKSEAVFQENVPWRMIEDNGIPKIHKSPLVRIRQNPYSDYALFIMKDPNPIGNGLGNEAILEAAGRDCVVPGQSAPIKLLGLKVWPIVIDLSFMEPIGKQLTSIGKFMDSAVDLMNRSFIDDR